MNEKPFPLVRHNGFCRPRINPFEQGWPVVDIGRQKIALRHILAVNNADKIVIRRQSRVNNGTLLLRVTLPDGCRMKPVKGLGEIDCLSLGVAEEPRIFNPGWKLMLYGWVDDSSWGNINQAHISYMIARRVRQDLPWEFLLEPDPHGAFPGNQLFQTYHALTEQAVRQGLNGTRLRRWKRVYEGGMVYHAYLGQYVQTFGFQGQDSFFSLISERREQVVAEYYADELAALEGGLVKAVALSEARVDLKEGRVFVPLMPPKVIFAQPTATIQYRRLRARTLSDFLLADNLKPGDFLDLDDLLVSRDTGEIRFVVGKGKNKGLVLVPVAKFKGDRICGRLVLADGQKQLLLWRTKKDREQQKKPLKRKHDPKPFVMAEENSSGRWAINWVKSDPTRRQHLAASRKYGNFVFATVHDKVDEGWWPVHTATSNEQDKREVRVRRCAQCGLRGKRLGFDVTRFPQVGDRLYTRTKELESERADIGSIKVIEFYADSARQDFLGLRLISLKPAQGHWLHFWTELNNGQMTHAVLKGKLIGEEELFDILLHPYFAPYRSIMGPILEVFDDLKARAKRRVVPDPRLS